MSKEDLTITIHSIDDITWPQLDSQELERAQARAARLFDERITALMMESLAGTERRWPTPTRLQDAPFRWVYTWDLTPPDLPQCRCWLENLGLDLHLPATHRLPWLIGLAAVLAGLVALLA